MAFNAQASSGSITLTNATGTITSTATYPTAVYLYDGSTLLTSATLNGSNFVFANNFTDVITAGVTKVFTIRADFPSNTTAGTVAYATLGSVTYTTSGDKITTKGNLGITGNNQTFYAATPGFTFISGSASTQTAQYTGWPSNCYWYVGLHC